MTAARWILSGAALGSAIVLFLYGIGYYGETP